MKTFVAKWGEKKHKYSLGNVGLMRFAADCTIFGLPQRVVVERNRSRWTCAECHKRCENRRPYREDGKWYCTRECLEKEREINV